jgi:hypothetical protein
VFGNIEIPPGEAQALLTAPAAPAPITEAAANAAAPNRSELSVETLTNPPDRTKPRRSPKLNSTSGIPKLNQPETRTAKKSFSGWARRAGP